MLHNHASLHTFGVTLHVDAVHSVIVHVGFHDTIGATSSVYVNVAV